MCLQLAEMPLLHRRQIIKEGGGLPHARKVHTAPACIQAECLQLAETPLLHRRHITKEGGGLPQARRGGALHNYTRHQLVSKLCACSWQRCHCFTGGKSPRRVGDCRMQGGVGPCIITQGTSLYPSCVPAFGRDATASPEANHQ